MLLPSDVIELESDAAFLSSLLAKLNALDKLAKIEMFRLSKQNGL